MFAGSSSISCAYCPVFDSSSVVVFEKYLAIDMSVSFCSFSVSFASIFARSSSRCASSSLNDLVSSCLRAAWSCS